MKCAVPITLSLGLLVLAFDKPVIFAMSSFTHFRFLHKAICRLCDVGEEGTSVFLDNTGCMGFIFERISCANVYVASVCEHRYDLKILYPGGCCMCMLWLSF